MSDSPGAHLGNKVPYLTATRFIEVFNNVTYFTAYTYNKRLHYIPKRKSGDIQKFTNKSRLRAMHLLNMIDPDSLHSPHFITLTYHNEFPKDAKTIKEDLDSFLKRFRRRWPDMYYFWRIELQVRGAPHYHLITWQDKSCTLVPRADLLKSLNEIWTKYNRCGCNHCVRNSVRVDFVNDMSRAIYYVNKYLSKSTEESNNLNIGRLWGNSRSIPITNKGQYFESQNYTHALQNLMLIYQYQYTKTNSGYLTWLLRQNSFSLFIPHKIFNLLKYALDHRVQDPLAFVASKTGARSSRPHLLRSSADAPQIPCQPTLNKEAPANKVIAPLSERTQFEDAYRFVLDYISGRLQPPKSVTSTTIPYFPHPGSAI